MELVHRSREGDRQQMSGGLTMSTVAEALKGLMDHREEALQVTIKTGYWNDTIACAASSRGTAN